MRTILAAGESLTAVMSGAAATTNPTAFVDSVEGSTESVTPFSLNGTTPVALATANLSRRVNSVTICNIDTAAVTVTLKRLLASGTAYPFPAITLQVGDTLTLDSNGLRVVDSSGQFKQAGVSTAIEPFAILATDWKKADGVTPLAASASTTNPGVVIGTDGTNFPTVQTIDGKAATTAVVMRTIVRLPSNYAAGSSITLRFKAGMITTVSDTSCTLGVNVYSNAGNNIGSADINATSAQSINSLTFANKDFTITPTGLVAGQELHIKVTITITDSATATAVIGAVGHTEIRPNVSR